MRNLKKILSVLLVVAMLVASMVPAFAAETFTYEAQAKALYDLKLFNGVSATEYAPDLGSSLTREQGFKIILSLIGKADAAKALTAAEADAALATYGDAKDVEPTLKNYVAYAVKNGLVKGDGKNLDAKGAMLGKDFATVLLRQLGYADTEFAYDTAAADLAAKGGLTTAEATKFNTKALIRDDLVGMAYGSLQATYKAGTTVIAKLVADKVVTEAAAVAAGVYKPAVAGKATVAITGAKKFTVSFDAAVDISKVAVAVKRGSVVFNVAKYTAAADNKSVVVEMATNLTKGDYELSVTGASTDAIALKVTAEDEKVTKIEFTSDKAVLTDKSVLDTVNVFYKIFNQYNEDVTSAKYSDVTFSASKYTSPLSIASKKITITSTAKFAVDEKISVQAVHSATGTFASAILTVAPMAQVSDVTIDSLYNADAKTLSMTSTYGDFYLVVTPKDQYGNSVSAANVAGDVIVTTSDSSIVTVDGGVNTPNFITKKIDGSDKVVLALAAPGTTKAGSAVISIIPKITGKLATYTVTVKETAKVDTLSLSAPEIAVAGEKTNIPFQAIDQFGAEMTKDTNLTAGMTTLTASVDNTTIPVTFVQDYVTGKANLVLDATTLSSATEKKIAYITGQTKTNKFVNLAVTLEKPAVPTSVSGLKSDYVTKMVKYAAPTLEYDKVIVKDQYGREIVKDDMKNKYYTTNLYRLTVESSDTAKITATASVNVSGAIYAVDSANAATLYAADKGSITLKVGLQKYDATKATPWVNVGDSYPATFTSVEKADIASYEVADVAKMFDVNATRPAGSIPATTDYAKSLTVNGLMADGSKVSVPYSYTKTNTVGATTYYNYYVNPVNNTNAATAVVFDAAATAKKLSVNNAYYGTDVNNTETTIPVVVTVIGDKSSTVVTKTLAISKVAPKLTTLSLVTNGVATFEGGNVVSVKATAVTATSVAAIIADAVKTVDSYGVEHKAESTYYTSAALASAVITNAYNAADKAIDAPAITDTGLVAGTKFDVTVITVDGATLAFKVIVK